MSGVTPEATQRMRAIDALREIAAHTMCCGCDLDEAATVVVAQSAIEGYEKHAELCAWRFGLNAKCDCGVPA